MSVNKDKLVKKVGCAVLLILLLTLPLFVKDPYTLHILIITIMNVILAVSIRLILTVGEMSIAHAAFMAIGGYTSALLVTRLGLSFWLTLLLGGIMATIIAILIGYITLRLKGFYFSLVTLAFAEIVLIVITRWDSLLGGYAGISDIPPPNPVFGIEFTSKVPYYYLILLLGIVTIAIMYRIDKSWLGRIFNSIRQSALLSESMGINIMRYKVLAFAIGCFFAGIVGAFQAHYYTVLAPAFFTLWESIYCLIYAQVGGVANIAGPAVGAIFLTIIPEFLRAANEFQPLIFGAILIVVILFLPGGLITIPGKIRSLAAKFTKAGER